MSKERDPYVIPDNADQVHDDLQELYDFTYEYNMFNDVSGLYKRGTAWEVLQVFKETGKVDKKLLAKKKKIKK